MKRRARSGNALDGRRGVTDHRDRAVVEQRLDAQVSCSVDVLVDPGEGELELRYPVGDGNRSPDLRPPSFVGE